MDGQEEYTRYGDLSPFGSSGAVREATANT